MMDFLGQGIAAAERGVQIFGEGLNEIDFQRKPGVADAPRESPGAAQQCGVLPGQTGNNGQ